MKNIVTKLSLLVFLAGLSFTLSAQQKGVAINKPSLDNGLILDVSGLDAGNRFGVRFSPLSSAPQTAQEGSMYFNTTLNTYLQWTGAAWQRMTGAFAINSFGQAAFTGDVRIDGFVGIGRSPGLALDITGSIEATGSVTAGSYSSIGRIITGSARFGENNVTTDPGTSFNLQVWGDSWFRSSSSTGDPTHTYIENLAVQQNGTGLWYTVDVATNPFSANFLEATSSDSPSDNRLKEDLSVIDNALAKVSALRGITYNWNDEAKDLFTDNLDNGAISGPEQSGDDFKKLVAVRKAEAKSQYAARETGLIAQDIQKVLPEAVVEAEDGYLRVKYGHLAGLFVEAIKEQQAIIDAQAERIRELEDQQLSVLARLEKLEASTEKSTTARADK